MKEEDILDQIATSPRDNKRMWFGSICMILSCVIAFSIPRMIKIFFKISFPLVHIIMIEIFLCLTVLTIGIFIFIKNTNFESTSLVITLLRSFSIILIGLSAYFLFSKLMSFLLPPQYSFYWANFEFSFRNLKDILLMDFILTLSIALSIYYKLKNNNNWLLPLVFVFLLLLTFIEAKNVHSI